MYLYLVRNEIILSEIFTDICVQIIGINKYNDRAFREIGAKFVLMISK